MRRSVYWLKPLGQPLALSWNVKKKRRRNDFVDIGGIIYNKGILHYELVLSVDEGILLL
jgi:hypothetical protein